MIKKEAIPTLLIILMGMMDCITTVVGVVYAGTKELNPAMAAIVDSNVGAFLVVKIASTAFIALTYVFARKILMQLPDQNGKTLSYSIKALTLAYVGIICFLGLAVANNLILLIH